MRKDIALLAAALLLCAGTAWAQMGGVVAPVTSPQTTGSTVQGMSGAAQPQAPAPAPEAKDAVKAVAPMTDKKQ